MSREIMKIDPTQTKFCYNLTKNDCFFLRTGKCSVYLSDVEAEEISKQEEERKIEHRENHVMYCRNLMNSRLQVNYYNEPHFQSRFTTSIRMDKSVCGHFVFEDGQHRSCIAKHLGITSMYAQIGESEFQCAACNIKDQPIKEPSWKERIKALFKKEPIIVEKNYDRFIDEELMTFSKRKGEE